VSVIRNRLDYITGLVKIKVNNKVANVEEAPIFILGNEKSGTTVIADLLAKACDSSHLESSAARYTWEQRCIMEISAKKQILLF
jgi:hypothetical protein